MNLRQIEAFLAVFEEGTFSAGAARLKVSQPTVSKLVDGLERGLGYKLFRRTGVRVSPTEQGFSLYRDMTRVKRGFDLLLEQARDLKADGGGRLAIGAGSALAPAFMPRLIARFVARHPGVQVTFEADGARYLIEQLLKGSLDIIFATRTLRSRALADVGTLAGEDVVSGREVCAVPVGHRLARKAAIEAADLDGEAFVGNSADLGSRREIDAMLARAGARVRTVAEASTPVAACALVAQGLGVTIASELSARAALATNSGGIVLRPIRPGVGYSVSFAMAPTSVDNPMAAKFRSFALENGPKVYRELVGVRTSSA